MTLFELHCFARGAAKREWEQTALLAALIHNAHISKRGKILKPVDFDPFKKPAVKNKPIEQLERDFGPRIDFGGQ